MKAISRFFLTSICAFAVSAAAADYKSEYRSYNSAIAEGDRVAALTHGEAAWREAEAALGDAPTTAILAYNYAVLVAESNPSKSLEAFDRAIDIAQRSEDAIPLQEARLRRAEARVRAEFENKAYTDELNSLLAASDPTAAGSAAEAQALGWRTVAITKVTARQFNQGKSAADAGLKLGPRIEPPDLRLQRELLFLAGLTRVASDRRSEEDIVEAIALFDRAATLFPPQRDIDHFDPLLAKVIGWRETVGSIANSYGATPTIRTGTRLPDGADLKSAYENAVARSSLEDLYRWQTTRPAACDADIWEKRKPPHYPAIAARRGFIGAILIGHDLDGVGVSRTVVLTDFTDAGFGAVALDSMKHWRLKPGLDPACWKNNITIFTFILN